MAVNFRGNNNKIVQWKVFCGYIYIIYLSICYGYLSKKNGKKIEIKFGSDEKSCTFALPIETNTTEKRSRERGDKLVKKKGLVH